MDFVDGTRGTYFSKGSMGGEKRARQKTKSKSSTPSCTPLLDAENHDVISSGGH